MTVSKPLDHRLNRTQTVGIFASCFCILTSFLVYLKTLCPTIAVGDTTEFISAAFVWGVPHAPGYPLYTFLGHLFTYLPIHSVAWRVNFSAAVYSSVAMGLMAYLIFRLTKSVVAGIGGALFLAFVEGYWLHGLVAEVFSLNQLLFMIVFLIAMLPGKFSVARLYWLGYMAGIAVGHHQLAVLLGPPLAWTIFRQHAHLRNFRVIAISLLLLVVGFFTFAIFIPIRAHFNPAINWGSADTVSGLIHLLTRGDYGGLSQPYLREGGELAHPRINQLIFYSHSQWRQWTPVGIGLIFLGVWHLFRHRKSKRGARTLQTLLFGWMLSGPIFLMYANVPVTSRYTQAASERFMLVSLLWMGLLAGFGVLVMARWVRKMKVLVPSGKGQSPESRVPSKNLITKKLASVFGRYSLLGTRNSGLLRLAWLASFLFLIPLLSHWTSIDQSSNTLAYHYGIDLLKGTQPHSLILVAGDAPTFNLDYFNAVENRTEGRKVINVAMLRWPWYEAEMKRRYPEIKMTSRDIVGKPGEKYYMTWDLVRENIDQYPVYVVPVLIERDNKLAEDFYFEPTRLVARVSKTPEFELSRFLKAHGFDFKAVSRSSSDSLIASVSKREKRILVTNDADFCEYSKDAVFAVFAGKLVLLRTKTWETFPLGKWIDL